MVETTVWKAINKRLESRQNDCSDMVGEKKLGLEKNIPVCSKNIIIFQEKSAFSGFIRPAVKATEKISDHALLNIA